MTRSELCATIDRLAVKRPVFHSEADFQHEMALQLASIGYEVRLEMRVNVADDYIYIDLTANREGQRVAIELKYIKITGPLNPVIGVDRYGELFEIFSNWGPNLSRYDTWSDYSRISCLVNQPNPIISKGYAILLTNVADAWNEPGNIMARNFPLHDGTEVHNSMDWVWNNHTEDQKSASVGSTRVAGIRLCSTPKPLKWEEYSKPLNDPSPIINELGHFRYLILETP